MKRISRAALVVSVLALAACASEEMSSYDSVPPNQNAGAAPDRSGGESAAPAPGSGGTTSSSSSSGGASTDGERAGTGTSGTGGQTQAGVLTAGVWDDNLNFPFFSKYLELSGNLAGAPFFSAGERDAAQKKWAQRTGSTELDVAFLIDTTGSMGDELSYLQREIDDIATTIQTKFPSTTARYGLVLYRDVTDQYVTRWFDFKGIQEFRDNLAKQAAGGGGDIPEAVPQGLEQTMNLGWRTGAVTRLAFWVADAPHHKGTESAVRAAIDTAVQKDVHLYPVAASGTDPLAELTMRSAAQITGGRYIFLTDDSGVGGSHAEPHIPCYHVTKFNTAIVRMVESEMKGTHIAPAPTEILRTVGSPVDGRCQTRTQGPVTIY